MGLVGAAFHMPTLPLDQTFQGKGCLDGNKITDQTGDFLGTLDGLRDRRERLWPRGHPQLAVFTDIRPVQTLTPQPVPDKARLVGNPFLVHTVMVARQDAHDLAPLAIHPNAAAKRIHHVDGFGLGQFPRTRSKGIGLADQRANRAQINDVALQIAVERLPQIAGDLGILAASSLTHLHDPGHLGGKTHTARARDATRHMGLDQRAKVQILARPLWFAIAAEIYPIGHGLILQIAFSALIADRAIKRMVDEQKLHHPLAGLFDHGAVGLDNRRLAIRAGTQILDLHGAACRRFGRTTHDLDKTHPAIPGNRQPLVITEARHLDPGLLTGLNQGHCALYLDLLIVDDDLA